MEPPARRKLARLHVFDPGLQPQMEPKRPEPLYALDRLLEPYLSTIDATWNDAAAGCFGSSQGLYLGNYHEFIDPNQARIYL